MALPNPGLDQLRRVATKGRAAFLSALADAADVGSGAEDYVPAAQTDKFGRAQPGLKRKQEQGVIATPRPCRSIRRRQKRHDFLCV